MIKIILFRFMQLAALLFVLMNPISSLVLIVLVFLLTSYWAKNEKD